MLYLYSNVRIAENLKGHKINDRTGNFVLSVLHNVAIYFTSRSVIGDSGTKAN